MPSMRAALAYYTTFSLAPLLLIMVSVSGLPAHRLAGYQCTARCRRSSSDPVFGGWQGVVEVGNAVGGFLLVAFMFGLIYKVMPRQRVLMADVWLGALLAALLFTAGKTVIGAYIGRSGVASGFGAAGSLVVVLLWVYFSAQILLLGAAFTCVYARTFGSLASAPATPDPPNAS